MAKIVARLPLSLHGPNEKGRRSAPVTTRSTSYQPDRQLDMNFLRSSPASFLLPASLLQ